VTQGRLRLPLARFTNLILFQHESVIQAFESNAGVLNA